MKKFALWLLAVSILGWCPSFAQETFSLEQRLPEDTLVYLSLPNIGRVCQDFEKTALSRLFQDEEVRAFADSLLTEDVSAWMNQSAEEAFEQIGIPPEALAQIFSGEVAFAVLDLQTPQVVLSVQFGEGREALEKLLEQLKSMLNLQEQRRGGSVTYHGSVDGQRIFAAIIDGALVISTDSQILKKIRGREFASPLSAHSVYGDCKARVQKGYTPVAFAYVNIDQVWKQLEGGIPPEAEALLTAWGVRDIHAFAYGMNLHGAYVHEATFVAVRGERTGISRFLYGPDFPKELLREAPASAMGFWGFHHDMSECRQHGEELVKLLPQEMGEEFRREYRRGQRDIEKALGFSLAEVAEFLGGDHCAFYYFDPQENILPYFVGISSLRDSAKFLDWTGRVCAKAGFELGSSEYAGKTIYRISHKMGEIGTNPFENLGRMRDEQAFLAVVRYLFSGTSFFVENGRVYWSVMAQDLKHFAAHRGELGTLDESEAFRSMAPFVSGNTSYIGYLDPGRFVEVWWNTAMPLALSFEGYLRAAGIPLDGALVPAGETIARYMLPSITTYSAHEAGVVLESYSVVGRQMHFFLFVAGLAGVAAEGGF